MKRLMKRRLLAVVFFLLPLTTLAAPEVLERRLDNGLKILVKPNHRAPILTSQIWYRIGSSYEHGGITGISHVLEHMMFQGTEALRAPTNFPASLPRMAARRTPSPAATTPPTIRIWPTIGWRPPLNWKRIACAI